VNANGMQWQSDEELFRLMQDLLYAAVAGDILDRLGLFHQFLPQAIKPLRETMKLAGQAMPVHIVPVSGPQERAFGRLTEALDDLRPGEIYIATGAIDCASWGEIMTAAARTRGASGAVIDGYHRDTVKVLEQNWPVFSRGSYAQDAGVRSSITDFRCPIEIEQVQISPGDLVFGDLDGVLIIPRDVEREVIRLALEKARHEVSVRGEIEGGASSTSVYRKYGVF
jgi:4-hydroxy-4-methyl-2-oxoglutarate aldolase